MNYETTREIARLLQDASNWFIKYREYRNGAYEQIANKEFSKTKLNDDAPAFCQDIANKLMFGFRLSNKQIWALACNSKLSGGAV